MKLHIESILNCMPQSRLLAQYRRENEVYTKMKVQENFSPNDSRSIAYGKIARKLQRNSENRLFSCDDTPSTDKIIACKHNHENFSPVNNRLKWILKMKPPFLT